MAYKENPIKKMESNAKERSNLLNINPLSKHMSTPFSMGGSSSILMGHSPNEMRGDEDPPKKERKNTSGVFGGDTIMGDENKDGNMLTRGFKSARDYMKRNFPMESGPTRPIFKDGKLNFDASLMDKVGTGLD